LNALNIDRVVVIGQSLGANPAVIIRAPENTSGKKKGLAVPPAVAERALRSTKNSKI
jgi:hypothetical protein